MLKRIPAESDLARVYYELAAIGARCVGKKRKWPYPKMDKYNLLALAADMSRYDPRLLGILVEYFIERWKEINPVKLKEVYPSMETPQIFGVISEFSKTAQPVADVEYYSDYLAAGMKPIKTQLFFHGIYSIGGSLAEKTLEESLAEYKRWGFLATERPTINAETKESIGTLDTSSRLNVLKRLLAKKKVISISEYLKRLGHSISRQQALIDLKACKSAVKVGRGRGSRWKYAA